MRYFLTILCFLSFTPELLAGQWSGGSKDKDEEKEPEPGVAVERSRDVVILTDGTKITCTIIAAGGRRLLVLEEGANSERAIDRAKIESFRRGEGSGNVELYVVETDVKRGLLVLRKNGTGTGASGSSTGGSSGNSGGSAGRPADLGKLWKLLEGKKSAAELATQFKKNPQWNSEISRMVKAGKVPPRGLKAFGKIKKRIRSEKAFRNGLAELVKQGKLPPGVLEILRAR
jgi:hypothetical protein